MRDQTGSFLHPGNEPVFDSKETKKASIFYDSVWGGNGKRDALDDLMGLDWREQG